MSSLDRQQSLGCRYNSRKVHFTPVKNPKRRQKHTELKTE
jgi:hypothetical protein